MATIVNILMDLNNLKIILENSLFADIMGNVSNKIVNFCIN